VKGNEGESKGMRRGLNPFIFAGDMVEKPSRRRPERSAIAIAWLTPH